MIMNCTKCSRAEDVSYKRLPDKMVQYLCVNAHEGGGEHTWIWSLSSMTLTSEGEEGVTDELLEPLLACVLPGEPFVKYGVVEHRFRLANPELFVAHIKDRGHVMHGTTQATATGVSRTRPPTACPGRAAEVESFESFVALALEQLRTGPVQN